jgi:hypothetical protein
MRNEYDANLSLQQTPHRGTWTRPVNLRTPAPSCLSCRVTVLLLAVAAAGAALGHLFNI